jgi:hypothetical protein
VEKRLGLPLMRIFFNGKRKCVRAEGKRTDKTYRTREHQAKTNQSRARTGVQWRAIMNGMGER